MRSAVSKIPAAQRDVALEYFTSKLSFETDCLDVSKSIESGADFVLLDVRTVALFAAGHLPGAISLPCEKIAAIKMDDWPADTLFVTYGARSHCNEAIRGARHLAALARPVKVMIGGFAGWVDQGFKLARPEPTAVTRNP